MKKEKMIAGALAVATIAANVTAMPTEAVTPPGISSNFDYELDVEPVSKSQLKLTFYTTNNPGVSVLDFYIFYDPDKYHFVSTSRSDELYDVNEMCAISRNEELGLFFFTSTFNANAGTEAKEKIDYSKNFEICVYLEADDGNVEDEDLSEFSVALANYKSQNENINKRFIKASPTMDDIHPELNIAVTPSQTIIYDYMLGDADGSGDIEISDATNINALANNAQAAGLDPEIRILNHKIVNNEMSILSNGKKLLWGESCSAFLRTVQNATFSCVEAADANRDGVITTADGNLVLNWYASLMIQVPVEEILEVQHKTVCY